jgi:GAF domain-containing protein
MFVALVENEDFLSFPFVAEEETISAELMLYPRRGLTAAIIASGRKRWLTEEPDLQDKYTYTGARAADWLGVPLVDREGGIFGAVVVQSYDESFRFKPEDAAFIEYAAIQIAIAMQFHTIDREMAVRRISALVEDTTDLEHLYPGIHSIVSGLIPSAAHSFIILRIDRDAGVFVPAYCVDEREKFGKGSWPLDQGLSGFVAAGEGRSFVFEDGVTPEPAGCSVLGERPAFWLGVPIRLENSMLGIAITETYDPRRPITRDDERSLEAICPHIAQAIARTLLLRGARR